MAIDFINRHACFALTRNKGQAFHEFKEQSKAA